MNAVIGGSGRRILLVEDEAMLRSLMTSVLTSAGHQVVSKDNGEEVLTLIESGEFYFEAMITDLRLETIDGVALARSVHARFPETRILLTTGYGASPSEDFPVLPKPFRPAELVQAVNELFS